MAVQKNQRIHCLILGGGGNLLASGKRGKKLFNLLCAVPHVLSWAHTVIANIFGNPVTILPFGMNGVVLKAHIFSHFFKKFFLAVLNHFL